MSFKICRGTLSSLAMFTAKSLVARQPLHRHLPLWLVLKIQISELLTVGVLHDEKLLTIFDRPGRPEAARRWHGAMIADRFATELRGLRLVTLERGHERPWRAAAPDSASAPPRGVATFAPSAPPPLRLVPAGPRASIQACTAGSGFVAAGRGPRCARGHEGALYGAPGGATGYQDLRTQCGHTKRGQIVSFHPYKLLKYWYFLVSAQGFEPWTP